MKSSFIGIFILLTSFSLNAVEISTSENGSISCSSKEHGMFIELSLKSKERVSQNRRGLFGEYTEVSYKKVIGLLQINKNGKTFRANYHGSFTLSNGNSPFFGDYFLQTQLHKSDFKVIGMLSVRALLALNIGTKIDEKEFNLLTEGEETYQMKIRGIKVEGQFYNFSLDCRIEEFAW